MSVPDTYPPFSGDDPRCVKCGYLGASTEWCPAEKMGGYVLEEERLRRQCLRCGWRWTEAVVPPEVTE